MANNAAAPSTYGSGGVSAAGDAGSASRGGVKRRFLSHGIAYAVMAASAAIAVVCGALFAVVLYMTIDSRAAEELDAECTALAVSLDNARLQGRDAVSSLEEQVLVSSSDVRTTLIAQDGSVLYDTAADAAALDNHAMRPEVIEAMELGEGQAGRFSDTLQEEVLYHSVRLADGSVIRLAVTQASVWGVMATMVLPCIAVIVVAVFLSALVGTAVARRISTSLSSVDLDDPLNSDAPRELVPLLERIHDQSKRLNAQADERRRFTASVSHELKTPLTVVSGYSEIISKGIARPEDVQEFAGLIYNEAQHMKAMVDDLLVISRLDAVEASDMRMDLEQDVSLDQVVASVVDRLQPSAENRKVSVSIDIPSSDGLSEIGVKGNRRMVEEMVRNLAENAIRYNVEGGSVRVMVRRDTRGCAVIRVTDTGEGIAPEFREKVFERFFCVDESRSKATGGSGLGLSIVKHAAQLHGASIVVRGNFPRGTIFEVTFPAA